MQQKQKRENKETDSALGKAWYPNIWFSIIILLLNYTIYYRETRDKTSTHRYTYVTYKSIYVKY